MFSERLALRLHSDASRYSLQDSFLNNGGSYLPKHAVWHRRNL